ncbi:MAG: GyrI-like domain-containing protein, partial [Clostridium sp.]
VAQINTLKQTEKRLTRKISTLEEYSSSLSGGVVFKNLDKEHLLVEKVQGDNSLIELDIALKKLITRAKRENAPYYYQIGAIIPMDNIKSGKYTLSEWGFLPLSRGIKSSISIQKESGLYACTYHRGSYETIGDTYEYLLKEVDRRGYFLDSKAYEYCIFDSLTSRKAEDYTTEIQIRVFDNKGI